MLKATYTNYRNDWKNLKPEEKRLLQIIIFWIILFGYSVVNIFFPVATRISDCAALFGASYCGVVFTLLMFKIGTKYKFEVGKRYQTRFYGTGRIISEHKKDKDYGFIYETNTGRIIFVYENGMFNNDGKTISPYDLMLGELPDNYPT